jgi:hypothetical protein
VRDHQFDREEQRQLHEAFKKKQHRQKDDEKFDEYGPPRAYFFLFSALPIGSSSSRLLPRPNALGYAVRGTSIGSGIARGTPEVTVFLLGAGPVVGSIACAIGVTVIIGQ